ncbi:IS110 family transposase [Arcanobacterium buesumense]|uniref:IS110 family transposase n=1 Tax=Arcanobacterium buesumense TaxID=2722751 RepID=A0A6H2EK29_9ACTO|nr:IS110 family transposase [Arcanobacterium buesumense]
MLSILDCSTRAQVLCHSFTNTPKGHARAQAWIARHASTEAGKVLVSMEGTASYGARFRVFLEQAGYRVVEAPRLLAHGRKKLAKNDALDAFQIAARTLGKDETELTIPRQGNHREALRILVTARKQLTRTTTVHINSLTALTRCADLGVDARKALSVTQIHQLATLEAHPDEAIDVLVAKQEARRLAKAIIDARAQLAENQTQLAILVQLVAPALLELSGVGPVTAAQMIISYSHAGRVKSEAAFAALAGTSPIPASSGNKIRYRLNRGGDRALNNALHTIALVRLRNDEQTREYMKKRLAEGKTKRETIRLIKRYLARKIYRLLTKELTKKQIALAA